VYKEQEVWAERDMACLSSNILSNLHSGLVCEARRRRREAAGSLQASETQVGEICSGSSSCLVSSAAAVAIRRRTSVRGRGGQSRVLTRKRNGIGSFANSGEEGAVAAAAALRLPAVFFVGDISAVLLRRRLGCCIVEDDDDHKKNKRDRRKQTTVIMSSSIDSEPSKIVKGAGDAILEDVPHLTDWLPGLPVRLHICSACKLHFAVLVCHLLYFMCFMGRSVSCVCVCVCADLCQSFEVQPCLCSCKVSQNKSSIRISQATISI
jgi:hypothetical protein